MTRLRGPLVLATTVALFALPAAAGINRWTTSGPEGGDVRMVAAVPNAPDILYAATATAIFKSTNAGASWTNLLVGAGTNVVALDPLTPTNVYAGGNCTGVIRSTDGGNAWDYVSNGLTGDSFCIYDLAIHPESPSTLYAATYAGVFRSDDAGDSWEARGNGMPQGAHAGRVIIDPSSPDTLYAATGAGVFKSTDAGGSWILSHTGLTFTNAHALTIDPADPDVLYASGECHTVFKSSNGGDSWMPSGSGSELAAQCVTTLTVDDPFVYAGTGGGAFKSSDGGATWSALIANVPTGPVSEITRAGDSIYASASAGVFRSTDVGASWLASNQGLVAWNVASLGLNPQIPAILFAGLAGTGGVAPSFDGGASWVSPNLLAGFSPFNAVVFDPVNPNTVYAGEGSGSGGLFKSLDGGTTWAAMNNGVSPSLVDTIAINPLSPQIAYVGNYNEVFKSTDGGQQWSSANMGLGEGPGIVQLAIDPVTPTTLYAASSYKGLFKSTNGGAQWDAVETGAQPAHVRALVVDPQTPTTLYISRDGTLLKSTDGGASWAPKVAGLSGNSIESLAIDPTSPQTLYAGSYSQVYKSRNGAEEWRVTAAGLPCCWFTHRVAALAVDPINPRIVHAATGGSGVFSLEQSPPASDTCAMAAVLNEIPTSEIREIVDFASSEPDDPNPSCAAGHGFKSVWFRYAAPYDGIIFADTFFSDYNTVLSVYTGACGALLPLQDGCNDDINDVEQSSLSFQASAGTTYFFAVNAFDNDGGNLVFHFVPPPPPPPTHTPTATSTPTRTPTPTVSPTGTITPTATPPPPRSDACETAGNGFGTFTRNLDSATYDPTDPIPPCAPGARGQRSVWHSVTAPSTGIVRASAADTSDTVLSVWTGSCGSLVPVAGGCNDDSYSYYAQNFAAVEVPALAGTTLHILLSQYDVEKESVGFTVRFQEARVVDSTVDAPDAAPGNGLCATSTGACTLRAAIQEANAGTPPPTPPVIFLPPGTYDLSLSGDGENAAARGDLDIARSLTIVGADAANTIVDAGLLGDRIFDVRSNDALVRLQNLTLRNGSLAGAGGAINSIAGSGTGIGNLTVSHCVIEHNTANGGDGDGGGISNSGNLFVLDTRVEQNMAGANGGGIASSSGYLAVVDSTISGNRTTGSGTDGGGISVGGNGGADRFDIAASTISGNSAVRHGGGLRVNIAAADFLQIENTTISGNSANSDGGGLYQAGGLTTLVQTTLANNIADADANGSGDGGGIRRSGGAVNIERSILADNIDRGLQAPDCSGTSVASLGRNIFSRGCTLSVAGAGDSIGSIADPIDVHLGPLQDNGDTTQTHAPGTGSPAVDGAGTSLSPPLYYAYYKDQRGAPRPRGTGYDVGAYEVDAVPTPSPSATFPPTISPSPTRTPTATPSVTPTPTTTTIPSPTASPLATSTGTETPTNTRSPTLTPTPTIESTSTPSPPPSATPTPEPTMTMMCAGDCNTDGEVTVDELLIMVNISLGVRAVADCEPGDVSRDGEITIEELILAVNRALVGCAA